MLSDRRSGSGQAAAVASARPAMWRESSADWCARSAMSNSASAPMRPSRGWFQRDSASAPIRRSSGLANWGWNRISTWLCSIAALSSVHPAAAAAPLRRGAPLPKFPRRKHLRAVAHRRRASAPADAALQIGTAVHRLAVG